MSELFNLLESKSPRLHWMERHGIKTKEREEVSGWTAWSSLKITKVSSDIGYGDTEDEAITQLVMKLGIKLWNEEAANV